ncbi:MAG: GAF domain-containing SpoIIE family protein phosphatase [Candidatus Kapaibacterium sp.]
MKSLQRDLQSELNRERYALSSLLDFVRTLTPDLGAEGIVRSVVRTVMGKALIKDAFAYLLETDGNFRLIYRAGFRELSLSETFPSETYAEFSVVLSNIAPLILPILDSDESRVPVCVLGFGHSLLPGSTILDEETFLESLSRLAAIAVTNARLFQSQKERERLESELRLAHEIQVSLLPQNFPEVRALNFAAYSKSSEVVGGDYYDVIRLSDSRVIVAIADVVGKGISAALTMANLQAALRAYAELVGDDQLTLTDVTNALNRLLHGNTSAERFITAVVAILDTEKYELEAAVCGHPAPIILSLTRSCREFTTNGIPLGILSDFEYETANYKIASGDRILFYTDGLSEAGVPGATDASMIGPEGVQDMFVNAAVSSDTLAGALDIMTSSGLDVSDDITILLVEVK